MTSDQQQAPTATVTTPTEREVHVERVFDAPRDRVFAVFTDPKLIPEWWGPTTVVDQMDARTRESGMNETYARLDDLLARLASR